jgi:protein tyrosine phosphatase (PTP) superfamily phosphohydrolase (DUF442 family)
VLDHIPPLDLPAEATDKKVTPPLAPAAERKPADPAPSSDHLTGRSARDSDSRSAGSVLPAPDPAPAAGGVPGIARFVAVDLKLAGGSTPTSAGLDWLTEKGYKTILDLRDPSETNVGFIAEAARRGLRYIPLPTDAKSIDRVAVDRFNFELGSSNARPLYFFDSDGTRSATLWYIRRITVDRVDDQIARREAEEMGLSHSESWLAATRFLEERERSRPLATETAQPQPSAATPPRADVGSGPVAPAPTVENQQTSPPKPVDPARKPKAAQASAAPGNTAMNIATDRSSDLRSYYSNLLAGLTVPLA